MTEIKSKNSIFPEFIEYEPVLETMRMNPVVKRILEKFPKACLGGSSVLYDVVLPLIEKDNKYFNSWNSRDFDIYCFDSDYLNIISFPIHSASPALYSPTLYPDNFALCLYSISSRFQARAWLHKIRLFCKHSRLRLI